MSQRGECTLCESLKYIEIILKYTATTQVMDTDTPSHHKQFPFHFPFFDIEFWHTLQLCQIYLNAEWVQSVSSLACQKTIQTQSVIRQTVPPDGPLGALFMGGLV